MDQDQEEKQRHVCKYCNKSFANGKILGGHMRCHVIKNPLKNQKKLNNNNDDEKALVNDNGDRIGYGLRVNPKKSSRVSASSDQETTSSSKEIPCGICGKEFDSMRALFGHMRHHSKRRQEKESDQSTVRFCSFCCRECGREFESLRALSSHMKCHSDPKPVLIEKRLFSESSGFVKRKRSRRSRLKFRSNCSILSLSESSSTVEGEADQETEEIAACLLMLSEGIWSAGELLSGEFSEEDNSLKLAESENSEFGIVSGCKGGFLGAKEPCDLTEIGVEKAGLSLGVSDPKPDCDDLDMMGLKPELDQDGKGKQTPINSSHETLESSNRRSEYKCRTCNKIFHSHQALGGHQTIHRPVKIFPSSQFEDFREIEAEETPEIEAAERVVAVNVTSVETNKEHKCHICFKVFASGQALGGHKRAHTVRESDAEEVEKIQSMSHEVCGISEHVIGNEIELKSSSVSPWWVRNSHKQELLVGLMPN